MSLPIITFTLLPDTTLEDQRLARAQNLFKPGVDFALDADGDLEWPIRFTTGLEAVCQGLRIRLLMVKGELAHNLDYGVPWVVNDHVSEDEAILGSKYDEIRLRDIFRPIILSTPGVISIRSLALSFDRPERAFTMTFEVEGKEGTILGSLEV